MNMDLRHINRILMKQNNACKNVLTTPILFLLIIPILNKCKTYNVQIAMHLAIHAFWDNLKTVQVANKERI